MPPDNGLFPVAARADANWGRHRQYPAAISPWIEMAHIGLAKYHCSDQPMLLPIPDRGSAVPLPVLLAFGNILLAGARAVLERGVRCVQPSKIGARRIFCLCRAPRPKALSRPP